MLINDIILTRNVVFPVSTCIPPLVLIACPVTEAERMRFKTSNIKEAKHSELVSCVGWSSPDDVYSVGDDHKILRWNLVSAETQKVAELPPDFYPTDLHWLPRSSGGGKKNETFLISSADGKLQLVGKGGRMEKPVEAHRGACLAAR